jgi:uncharacterized protein YlbG (UPF0298 family)
MTNELLAKAEQRYQLFLNEYEVSDPMKKIQAENFLRGVLHNQLVDLKNNNAVTTSQIGNYVIEYLNWMDNVLDKIK